VKYLPRFGFEPVVLTRKNVAYHSFDQEIEKDVRNVQVRRTNSLDPARLLHMLGMRKYRISRWHSPIKQTMNFPDNKTPWVPFAFSGGRTIDFDYIFVTAPPFSSFISAYYLAKSTGKPLVVDFRDAWLEFPFMPYKGKLQRKFVRYWEEKIVRYASVIIVVDDNIRGALLHRYPRASNKIHIIPNGYDPPDFSAIRYPKVFTVSYLGTIRGERDPQNFLNAAKRFVIEQNLRADDFTLKFIGHIELAFLNQIGKYGFATAMGHLPYQRAIAEFCASHLAVLITTGSKYFFPSRQNEYLASGLPIIVCGRSAGLHLLENAFKKGYPGWIFDYDDIDGMKNKIADVYKKYRKGIVMKCKTPYTEYTREKLTKRLAEIIKGI
jgi:glycosyltransferase involved in cell wall biosynthesis